MNNSTTATATTIDFNDIVKTAEDDKKVTLSIGELRELLKDMGVKMESEEARKRKTYVKTNSPFKSNGVRKPVPADPFRSQKEFMSMARELKRGKDNETGARDYMMLILGTTLGLRIGDLLSLRICDVWNGHKTMPYVELIEDKTNKRTRNVITKAGASAITEYMEIVGDKRKPGDPLFCSRNYGPNHELKPIDYTRAWHILNDASKRLGLKSHISTHSMRKTYGYSANLTMNEEGLPASVIMETLQAKFRHDSQAVTMHYIGIEQDNIDTVAAMVDNWVAGATAERGRGQKNIRGRK